LLPYFDGEVTDYLTNHAPALAAYYIVNYISQVQRKGPDLGLWEYLQGQQPEATFHLHGIAYAQLYPGPRYLTTALLQSLQVRVDGNFDGKIKLLGYDWVPRQGEATLSLFWQTLDTLTEDYSMSVRLLDSDGHRWAQQEGEWIGGLLPTSHSSPEYIVRDERTLPLLAGMPEGDYVIEIYVYSIDSGENLPVVDPEAPLPTFGLEAGTVSVPKQEASLEAIAPKFPVGEAIVEGIQLLGYDLPETQAPPGGTLSPVFYWRALTPITMSYSVRLWLEDEDGTFVGIVERAIAGGTYPTTRWQPDDVIRDWQKLPVSPNMPSGGYHLTVALTQPGEDVHRAQSFRLSKVRVEGRPHRFDVPPNIEHKSQVNFANQIGCLGYDLHSETLDAGGPLRLTLYWQALSPIEYNYKVFVHVVGPDGQIWGQRDTVPGAGAAPTASWLKDEVIVDTVEIEMDSDAPTGRYQIRVGWYDEVTGRRLTVVDERGNDREDSMLLGEELVLHKTDSSLRSE